MSDFLKADIFFFITSVSVVLVTAGALVLIYYAVRILRDVRAIVEKVRKAGEGIEQDFEALRANLREEGNKGKAIVDLIIGYVARKLTPLVKVRPKKKPSSSKE